ncbi:hypothetical protein [Azospirillum thermophilum]|uniref:hypothetical protein n=1 Tax=Azospirillum thermophilum TaxID=2202148 RepID=UPI001FE8496F|nr:hypothetical protein [Azospirillum thermophilum]
MPNAGTSELKLRTLASPGLSDSARARPLRVWPMTLTVLAAAMAVTLLMLGLAALQYQAQVRAELRDQLLGTSRVLEEHAAKVLGIHAATLKHVEWMVDDLGWERIAGSPCCSGGWSTWRRICRRCNPTGSPTRPASSAPPARNGRPVR